MKLLLATTALCAAMSFAPATAQEASDQQASPPSVDGVRVEGVKPSKVLGAIDTEKLTTEGQQAGADDQQANGRTSGSQAGDQAGPPLSIPERTTSVTTIETPAETAKPMVNIASVNVPLPQEVAAVAQKGKYSTKDLVNAQLMAMNNAPPLKQPVVNTSTITYPNDTPAPNDNAAPNAPNAGSAGQADQARTADGAPQNAPENATGNAGDLTTSPSSASPG